MPIKLDIVTAEKVVFSGDVDIVVVPGAEGEMGILPHHAPLMTTLNAGQITARKDKEEYLLAVSGGFLEVQPDRVIILADEAERAEEIDIARAEAAKRRAEELLSHPESKSEAQIADAALQRAIARIEVADRRKRRKVT
jgi:F-type H+-transporting ATPase subunit epsilon